MCRECLKDAFRVSGRCLKGLSRVSEECQDSAWRVSGRGVLLVPAGYKEGV